MREHGSVAVKTGRDQTCSHEITMGVLLAATGARHHSDVVNSVGIHYPDERVVQSIRSGPVRIHMCLHVRGPCRGLFPAIWSCQTGQIIRWNGQWHFFLITILIVCFHHMSPHGPISSRTTMLCINMFEMLFKLC